MTPRTACRPAATGLLYLPWLTGAQAPESPADARRLPEPVSCIRPARTWCAPILEGVAFNMRWVLPAVESFAEQRFDELLFSGGGAMSDAWSQIMADVTDRPVAQLATRATSTIAAPRFSRFVELGVLGLDDIDKLCRIKRRYVAAAAKRGDVRRVVHPVRRRVRAEPARSSRRSMGERRAHSAAQPHPIGAAELRDLLAFAVAIAEAAAPIACATSAPRSTCTTRRAARASIR